MVEGMDGGQFLGQESRLGGRNDEGNSITTLERPWPPAQITHLVWTNGVLDCFRDCGGPPCRGWIPAFAGKTEVGDFGPELPLDRGCRGVRYLASR